MRKKVQEVGLIIAGMPWVAATFGPLKIELREFLWVLGISLFGIIIAALASIKTKNPAE